MPKDCLWRDELESLAEGIIAETKSNPLYSAAGRGDTAEVSRLLASGLHADTLSSNGWTPLHYAAKEGHLSVVELLLDRGADVNARTRSSYLPKGTGDTPLHWAACEGHLAIVRYLLSNGADPDARNEGGQTPLHLAVMNCMPRKAVERKAQIIQCLLRHGANVNAKSCNGLTPLSRAEYGSELASLLREQGGRHAWELGIRGFLLRLLRRL